jgi:hypothetical protein
VIFFVLICTTSGCGTLQESAKMLLLTVCLLKGSWQLYTLLREKKVPIRVHLWDSFASQNKNKLFLDVISHASLVTHVPPAMLQQHTAKPFSMELRFAWQPHRIKVKLSHYTPGKRSGGKGGIASTHS